MLHYVSVVVVFKMLFFGVWVLLSFIFCFSSVYSIGYENALNNESNEG